MLTACVLAIAGCQSAPAASYGPQYMRGTCDVQSHLAARDLEELTRAWPAAAAAPTDYRGWRGEWVPIAQKYDAVPDMWRYFVNKEPDAAPFWILRSGGIAGTSDWYGPFVMTRDGELFTTTR